MILASLNETDNLYRFLVLLHVLAVIVGFGSTFVYPLTGNYASKHPGLEAKGISNAVMDAAKKLTEPAIYAAGVFGVILASVGPHDFSEAWVGISLLLYIAAVLFSLFVHQPNLRRMDDLVNAMTAGPPPTDGPPPEAAEMEQRGKAAARNGGILHLAFVVILVMMIWGARGGFA